MNVTANQVFPVETDLPDEWLSLLGCGITTGLGSVFNVAEVQPGSSVAVVGLGHLGQWMVQAAKVAGAREIIAVDPIAERRELAGALGATQLVDPSAEDPVEAVQEADRRPRRRLRARGGDRPRGPGAGGDDVAARRHGRRHQHRDAQTRR